MSTGIVLVGLLGLRLPASLMIAVLAFSKVIRYPESASAMWRPPWLNAPLWHPLVLAVALIELLCAAIIVVAPRPLAFVLVPSVLIGLTVYGLIALAAGGNCGCSGAIHERTTQKRLIIRNSAVVVAACLGALLGGQLTLGILTLAAPVVGLLPAISLVALAGIGLLRLKLLGLPSRVAESGLLAEGSDHDGLIQLDEYWLGPTWNPVSGPKTVWTGQSVPERGR